MTDIGTLIEVCKIIDAQLQSIYEQKEDYSVGYDPQNNSLSIGDFAASNALDALQEYLQKAIESELAAMEQSYGE
jgi:hypothetical protein